MGNFRVRKTITLPDGTKVNFNKNSISYTKEVNGVKMTFNPTSGVTMSTKVADGITYVDKVTKKSQMPKNDKEKKNG